MFGKKNKETARKVVTDTKAPENTEAKHEIHVEIRPLVQIEQHVLTVNGEEQKPQYRISIADRDVVTLSGREYHELFMEMLRHKDAGELIHDISVAHAEEHAHAALGGRDIGELLNGLETVLEPLFKGRGQK